jgi:hypothetical protein
VLETIYDSAYNSQKRGKDVYKMNKKILFGSFLAIIMIVAISFASAVETNTTDVEKKESPLYGLRTRRATTEKISNIINNIKAKFLGERMFFLPVRWARPLGSNIPILHETAKIETAECPSCIGWCVTYGCVIVLLSLKLCFETEYC